jgi:hypothetical protein
MEPEHLRRLNDLRNYERAVVELSATKLWPTVCLLGVWACQAAINSMIYGHGAAERALPKGD